MEGKEKGYYLRRRNFEGEMQKDIMHRQQYQLYQAEHRGQSPLNNFLSNNVQAISTATVYTTGIKQQGQNYKLRPALGAPRKTSDPIFTSRIGYNVHNNDNNMCKTSQEVRKQFYNNDKILKVIQNRTPKYSINNEVVHTSNVQPNIQIPQTFHNKAYNNNTGYNGNYKIICINDANNGCNEGNNIRKQASKLVHTVGQRICQAPSQSSLHVPLSNVKLPNQTTYITDKKMLLLNTMLSCNQSVKASSSTTNNNGRNTYNKNNQHPNSEILRNTDEMQIQSIKKFTGRRQKQRKRHNKKKVFTQTLKELELNKYINTMIVEYFGEHQKDKIQLFKFTDDHITNLDGYAEQLVEAGLGRIIENHIRINRKNNRQAFISISGDRETDERDGFINSPVARQYALEGDVVRAFVLNPGTYDSYPSLNNELQKQNNNIKDNNINVINGNKEQKDRENDFNNLRESPDTELEDISVLPIADYCPKGFVIKIITPTPMCQIVGTTDFKKFLSNNNSYYKLKPRDCRMPIVYIPVESCSKDCTRENGHDVWEYLCFVQIIETAPNGHCIGKLLQSLGKAGILENELKAIVFQNGLNNLKAYDHIYQNMYVGPMPRITEEQLRIRKDLRHICIFTIDPINAHDLDDALSVEILDNNIYEVGIHISDVSYFLNENSELDNLVKKRVTSIYLVNEVINMLPVSLCKKCSLLPGEDKFAFSVFFYFNQKGEIINSPRFVRSIIKSCTQFAYKHAQMIIDNPYVDSNDLPKILNNFTLKDVKVRILILHKLAEILKIKRYENGALSINTPKLQFNLDPLTGEPMSYEIETRKEANCLIEEFMLLTNQSVAEFIYKHFPDKSILRHHAPPLMRSMRLIRDRLLDMGLNFDISSSKAIYASMRRLSDNAIDSKALDACLNSLLIKPMARGQYFCSEGKPTSLCHYGLSLDIYTHFTSPLRRYPDILVHRLLAAAINCGPIPQYSSNDLHEFLKTCNTQIFNAKNASDDTINLYFKRYIKLKDEMIFKAVVVDIFQRTMNVVIIETGHTVAINYKSQKVVVNTHQVPKCLLIREKNSTKPPIKLQLFSTLDIRVVIVNNKLCGFFITPNSESNSFNTVKGDKHQQHNYSQLHRNNFNVNISTASSVQSKNDAVMMPTNRNRRQYGKRVVQQQKRHHFQQPQFHKRD